MLLALAVFFTVFSCCLLLNSFKLFDGPFWLGFLIGRDSVTFQDNGTEVPSLSRDKGKTGKAQNLAVGRQIPLSWDFCSSPCPGIKGQWDKEIFLSLEKGPPGRPIPDFPGSSRLLETLVWTEHHAPYVTRFWPIQARKE